MTTVTFTLAGYRPTNKNAALATAFRALRIWRQRARSRPRLAQMTLEQLEDIARTRDEAVIEAGKPFWRA